MTEFHPNFTYAELINTSHKEFDNTPTEHEKCIIDGKEVIVNAVANLPRLSQFLGKMKFELFDGAAVTINSGFRSHDVNNAVGSKDTSDHRRGCAADIRVAGLTPAQVMKKIIESDFGYQQVILEFYDPVKNSGWTHLAIPTNEGDAPKKSKLIIDASGTRAYA